MGYNQAPLGAWSDAPFAVGMTVFDVAGDRVGTVDEHDTQSGFLIVRKGWLFPQDLYVPFTSIERADADGIYLKVDKEDLANRDRDAPHTSRSIIDVLGATTYDQDTPELGAGSPVDAGDDDVLIPVREEQLSAATRPKQIGRAHVHKDVVEDQQTIDVPTRHERMLVERVPVSRQASAADLRDAFTERDIDVPLMGEEIVVEKHPVVREEVRLHKEIVTDLQPVSGTVRKERVTVEGLDMDDASPTPRHHTDELIDRYG